jgi:hypothetical protein
MKTTFINRSEDFDYFNKDFAQHSERNRVVVLKAPSGIGKSRFTETWMDTEAVSGRAAIKVSVKQARSNQSSPNQYLGLLASELNNWANNYNSRLTLNSVLRRFEGKGTKQNAAIEALSTGNIMKAVGKFAERTLGVGKFDPRLIFQSPTIENTLVMQDYIIGFFREQESILNIENIQNIDEQSLRFIDEMLREDLKVYCIFEFTEGVKDTPSCEEISRLFRDSGVYTTGYDLAQLKFGEAIKILRNTPGALEAFIERAYVETNGNLRPLIDLDVQLPRNFEHIEKLLIEQQIPLINATKFNIESRSQEELFLLQLIDLKGGSLDEAAFSEIVKYSPDDFAFVDYDQISSNLIRDDLLIRNEDELSIAQDTLTDLLQSATEYSGTRLVAAEIWRLIYEDILYNPLSSNNPLSFFGSKSEHILGLLNCYIQLDRFESIERLLAVVANYALENGFSASLRRYLGKIEILIAEKVGAQSSDILIKIMRLYSEIGLWSPALEISKKLDNQTIDAQLSHAALLSYNVLPQEAISLVDQVLSNHTINAGQTLKGELIKMAALRELNNYDQVDRKYDTLISNPRYAATREYGLLLRSIEMTNANHDKCAESIKQSIDYFVSINMPLEANRSRISSIWHLVYSQRWQEATEIIEEAQKCSENRAMERHFLNNNHAALLISLGVVDSSVGNLLKLAKITAEGPWEKLIIAMNTMIYFCFMGNLRQMTSQAMIVKSMLDSGAPADNEIRKIAHFNLAQYYRALDDEESVLSHLSEARKIQHGMYEDKWNRLLASLNPINPHYQSQPLYPFEPTFLSWWSTNVGE